MPKVPQHETGAYEIVCLANGLVYVGGAYTRGFKVREKEHWDKLISGTHENSHLQNAWNKYGSSWFVFVILERCPSEEVQSVEQKWMDLRECLNRSKGFNINPQASSGFLTGHPQAEEVRLKISRAARKQFSTTLARQKSSERKRAFYRTSAGESVKSRLSEATQEYFCTEEGYEHRVKLSNAMKNREPLKGEEHGNAILTEEIVREARDLRRKNPRMWTYRRLQKRYNCCFITIYKAVVGKTWSHVK